MQKFKETEDTRCIYKNELEKTCFQPDMAWGIELIYYRTNLLFFVSRF